jgi:two-component system, LytTR family, response regulator
MKNNIKKSSKEIILLVADNNYTTIYFKDGTKYCSGYWLGYHEEQLKENTHFLRISRSVILNINFIGEINNEEGKTYALLKNGNRFKVSRRRQQYLPIFK